MSAGRLPTNNMEETEREEPPEEDMSVLLYCKLLVRYHWIFFIVFLLIHLSFIGVSIALFMTGQDVLPLVFDDLPLDLNNDEMFLRYQAWNNRDADTLKATLGRNKRSAPQILSDTMLQSLGLGQKKKQKEYDFSESQIFNARKPGHFHISSTHSKDFLSDGNVDHHGRFKRQIRGVVSTQLSERRQVLADMDVIYETTDGSNILTRDRLLAIRDFEQRLVDSPAFSDYCRTEIYNRTHLRCFALASILRFFDPLFVVNNNGSRASDAKMERIPWFLTVLYNSTNFQDEMQYFLGRETDLNLAKDSITTNRIRTQVTFGFPLKSYLGKGNAGDPNVQLEEFNTKYAKPHLLPYLGDATKDTLPGQPIKVQYFIELLYWTEARDQVYRDWGFIIGGIVMIIISCWFYLDSLFITLIGMLSIVTSFAGANLMYRYMFEYRYFGIFNVLAVFIVIGIGVDDILIYVGTWRHYVKKNVKDLDVLTSVVFRKAAVTMFFTSLSTMVAFFVNTPSTLLAISAFGSFAGLCILVNYLTVVTFIPVVVLIHHLYFDKFTFLCCCNRYKKLKRVVEAPPKAVAWQSKPMHGSAWGGGGLGLWGAQRNQRTPPKNQRAPPNSNSFGSSNFRPWGLTSDPLYSPYHSLSDPLQVGYFGGGGGNPADYYGGFMGRGSMSAIRRVPFYDHMSSAWGYNNMNAPDNIDENIFTQPHTQGPPYEGQDSDSRTNSSASIIQDSLDPEKVKVDTLSERFSNACINFLSGPFFRFISNELVNVIIFVIFFAVTFGNCEAITRLKLGDADIPIFNPNHPFEKARLAVRDGFLLNPYDDTVNVALLWGLRLQDLSECNRLYYQRQSDRCRGKTVWDDEFDLNDPEAQLQLLKFCTDIIEANSTMRETLKLYVEIDTGKPDVICFIYYMHQWLEAVHATTNISQLVDVRLPVTKKKMEIVMATQPDVYDPKYITTITRPFELAFDFFLNNGYSGTVVTDERWKLSTIMYFEPINNINIAARKPGVPQRFIYEKRLKYAAMQVRTTVPSTSVDIETGVKVMNAWENFVTGRLKVMPKGVQNGFQVAFTWMWLNTLSNLVIQSGVGLGISLLLAFFVIFLGTGNMITSFVILILLAAVTICCVALITLASWKFSLLEAINMCIVVGLAVDYVVHLAESYHLSVYTNRKDRLKDALERVGMPVIAGACTTLMSAFFMLFGKIVFFIQFGAFLFCTLGFSIIFTLFVMTSFYSLLGPQGDFGSISGVVRAIGRKIKNRR